jgi:hypothetical protein
MGKIIFILLFVLSLQIFQANASDTTLQYQLIHKIQGSFSDFSMDNLGNIFLINNNNQIKKINPEFDSIGVFNDTKRFGKIFSIDVSNPLKLLVYYKDFNTIITLDRFLNIRNSIDLRKQNIFQAKVIATSYDNNIWVFDEIDATLKKIDDNGKIILQTADFRLLFEDFSNPEKIIDSDGMLYMYASKTGWYIFDYYGALKSKHSLTSWKDVQVINKILMGRNEGSIFFSEPKKLMLISNRININLKNCMKTIYYKKQIFLLTQEALEVYAQKIPA